MNKRWKEDQAEELATDLHGITRKEAQAEADNKPRKEAEELGTELHGRKTKQKQNINTETKHIFQSRMRQRRLLFLNKH